MSRGKAVLVAGAVLVGGLAFYDFFGSNMAWIGSFPLTVRVVPVGGQPMRRVVAVSLRNWEDADNLGDDPESSFEPYRLVVVPDYAGQAFPVEVRSWGILSGLGRDRSYNQDWMLAVWVEREGGARERVAVEVPDGRRGRELTVRVP